MESSFFLWLHFNTTKGHFDPQLLLLQRRRVWIFFTSMSSAASEEEVKSCCCGVRFSFFLCCSSGPLSIIIQFLRLHRVNQLEKNLMPRLLQRGRRRDTFRRLRLPNIPLNYMLQCCCQSRQQQHPIAAAAALPFIRGCCAHFPISDDVVPDVPLTGQQQRTLDTEDPGNPWLLLLHMRAADAECVWRSCCCCCCWWCWPRSIGGRRATSKTTFIMTWGPSELHFVWKRVSWTTAAMRNDDFNMIWGHVWTVNWPDINEYANLNYMSTLVFGRKSTAHRGQVELRWSGNESHISLLATGHLGGSGNGGGGGISFHSEVKAQSVGSSHSFQFPACFRGRRCLKMVAYESIPRRRRL